MKGLSEPFAQGLRAADPVVLDRRVEWDSIRRALRENLSSVFFDKISRVQSPNKNDPSVAVGTGLAALVGPAIISSMVDAYVSPDAMARLIKNGKINDTGEEVNGSVGTQGDSGEASIWRKAKYAFFASNPFTFEVDLALQGSEADRPLVLLFKWWGDWRLVRVFLPPM